MSLLLEALGKAKSLAAEKGEELIEEKGAQGFSKVVKQGRELLDTETDGELAQAGNDALDLLEENKTPFLRLGQLGFAHLVGHWQDEDEASARRHYLQHDATYKERRAAMQTGGDALANKRDAELAAWEEVKAVLKQVGTMGLKFLAKAVAASVGIPLPI